MLNNKNWKKYRIPLIAAGISMFAMFLRLDQMARHVLWSDEVDQLNMMHGSLVDLLNKLPNGEANSYLNLDHFLIYPFFKIFSFDIWGLAIPHIIITILGLYLLYFIGKRYFKTVWGYIITFSVFCFNSTLIEHATEIRPYAVLPTLALAVLYLSEILVNEVNLSPVKKFFIGAFFILTAFFHTYGFFIIFFCLVYTLLNKPSTRSFSGIFKDISKILIVLLFIGLPFWLFSVFGPQHYRFKWDVYKYIPNPGKDMIGFLKFIFGNLVGFKGLYFLLAALVFPFIFPFKERFRQISFLVLMVFLPILSVYLCDLIGQCYFVQRQFIWVIPYFAIFLGWSCDSFIGYISGLKLNLRKDKK